MASFLTVEQEKLRDNILGINKAKYLYLDFGTFKLGVG